MRRFQLESKIRRDEQPLFTRTHGNAAVLGEMDRLYPVNHVTGDLPLQPARAGGGNPGL